LEDLESIFRLTSETSLLREYSSLISSSLVSSFPLSTPHFSAHFSPLFTLHSPLCTLHSSFHLIYLPILLSGLHRFRIEKLHPVEESTLPDNEFLSGECYLVLHVPPRSEQTNVASPNERVAKVLQLYTWTGKDTSIDKRASAAIWAIYLNFYVGGKAKLILAEEGEEPIEFQALFSGTLEQKEGKWKKGTICSPLLSPPSFPLLYSFFSSAVRLTPLLSSSTSYFPHLSKEMSLEVVSDPYLSLH
jgi:hypothetical protein